MRIGLFLTVSSTFFSTTVYASSRLKSEGMLGFLPTKGGIASFNSLTAKQYRQRFIHFKVDGISGTGVIRKALLTTPGKYAYLVMVDLLDATDNWESISASEHVLVEIGQVSGVRIENHADTGKHIIFLNTNGIKVTGQVLAVYDDNYYGVRLSDNKGEFYELTFVHRRNIEELKALRETSDRATM